MKIQLKKGRDGRSSLACLRADGTRTWARVHPFFPEHDLTHCAVESVLRFREAFFGLVASGWEIDAFAVKQLRLPAEAMWAENIVGLLDLERAAGQLLTAAELNEQLATVLRKQNLAPFRAITDDEVNIMRQLRGDLVSRWRMIPEGDTLEVGFPQDSGP